MWDGGGRWCRILGGRLFGDKMEGERDGMVGGLGFGVGEEGRGDEPAQFTSDEGEGRDLYACHSNEATFARLLWLSSSGRFVHVMMNCLPDLYACQ